MQSIATTTDGKIIAILETLECNLLSAIIPMIGEAGSDWMPATQPISQPVDKIRRATSPIKPKSKIRNPQSQIRFGSVTVDSPLKTRIARKLELYERPMRVKEICSEIGVSVKSVGSCLCQNPKLFKKASYGTWTLASSSNPKSEIPNQKSPARLAAIRAAHARVVAREPDPLEKAGNVAATIAAEEA